MSTLRVGLTGGIASGKSTVGRLLAEAGCLVTDADRIVAELYRPGEAGAAAVRELFGDEMLTANGEVDRAALGRRVFGDDDARRRLEQAVHPLVGQRYAEILASTDGIVVFEVPLLVETGSAANYDVVITVEADPELRIERAVERGLAADEARARLRAQTSSEQRIAAADIVVRNDGSLEDLERQVDAVVARLRERLAAG